MLSIFICLLASLLISMNSASEEPKCIPVTTDVKEMKCLFGKDKGACIPLVLGTTISWNDVSPVSLLARWQPVPRAICYHVELISRYTSTVLRTFPCHRDTKIEISDLRPFTIYGVQVRAVNERCELGRPGKPARTRTLWAPTVPTTRRPIPTFTPEPEECGVGYFTCENDKCIPNRRWCNRIFDCDDKSDERGCPGGCEELDIDFPNGNYSCSRWGSPGSVCTFDCQKPYVIDGSWYTQCIKRDQRWRNAIPTCRLSATRSLKVRQEEITASSLTLEWESVQGAARYAFLVIEKTSSSDFREPLMKMKSVGGGECCVTNITELHAGSEYVITMRAIDEEDLDGKESRPVFGTTVKEVETKEKYELEEE